MKVFGNTQCIMKSSSNSLHVHSSSFSYKPSVRFRAKQTMESIHPLGISCIDPTSHKTFKVSYDEGFGGHFSVPEGNGAVADFAKVIAKDDPFGFDMSISEAYIP